MSDDLHHLKQLIVDARQVVAFTGAGISTESGIPDFRSPGGIWTKFKPIDFRDFRASEEMQREAWRRKFATDETTRKATPNAGHRALARLAEDGKLRALITQNIDGLHQASGVPDDKIIELHGNGTYATCLECSRRHEIDWAREVFEHDETVPMCVACGGLVKTATISFGQAMPEDEMQRAHEATLAADLFIVLGSSLVVYPAAGFPVIAKRNGADLVIINREPTEQDDIADLVINAEIGATMAHVVGIN